MDKNRSEILKLIILSAWISAAGGAAFSPAGGATCEDKLTIGCLPANLRESFGEPAPRAFLNSRFKIKARKKTTNENRRKKSHNSNQELQLSNQQEITGNPGSNWYDVTQNTLPHFDPTKKVVVIIHGWQIANEKVEEQFRNETKQTVKMGEWVSQLQEKILENDDVNVIVYDWRGGAMLGYMESRRNTWTAAQEVYLFLKSLIETRNVDTSQIHLIGHSLGCHVAGIAGKRMFAEMGSKIGRLSALDPAAPSYSNAPEEVRLSKGDATFVDVYHTDGGSLLVACGMYQPLGHVDFYPNNGTDQPFCHDREQNGVTSIFEKELCDHMIAYEYYMKSITHDAQAIQCDSYSDFLEGKCANCKRHGCKKVGYFLNTNGKDFKNGEVKENRQGRYYYQTSKESDYCAKTLMLQVQWSRGVKRQLKKKKKFGQNSKLVFTIEGNKGSYSFEQGDLDKTVFHDGTRTKQDKYVKVVPIPCHLHPLPVKSVKVELIQNCNKEVSMRSFWGSIFTGGCSDIKLHIRRIKLIQLNPSTYADNFIPKRKSDDGRVMWLRQKVGRIN